MFPAGTTNCSGPVPGGEAAYTRGSDLAALGWYLATTAGRCRTAGHVARAHGLRTAWSDKHPAYQMFNGPTGTNGPDGTGVQDYFTPEINSAATSSGADWTTDNALTMQYDSFKVQAILNEIDGYDHSRSNHVGVPAIFGMNFQTVSTAQKLPTSDGLTGGYLPGGTVPGPLLVRALNYINTEVGLMVSEIRGRAGGVMVSLDDEGCVWLSDGPDGADFVKNICSRTRPRGTRSREPDHGLGVRADEGLRGRRLRGSLRRPGR